MRCGALYQITWTHHVLGKILYADRRGVDPLLPSTRRLTTVPMVRPLSSHLIGRRHVPSGHSSATGPRMVLDAKSLENHAVSPRRIPRLWQCTFVGALNSSRQPLKGRGVKA